MKRLLSKYAPLLLTLFFGLVVFLFWAFRYPFALTYQEQLQLFLFDGDYFCIRMAEPGGFARYIAEFLVQFYNGAAIGALILAVILMLVQRLTWRLMRADSNYCLLSFIPAFMLWYAMGDENFMLTYAVALVIAMAVMLLGPRVEKWALWQKMVLAVVLVPLLYWLIGPMVLLVALGLLPLSWMTGLMTIYALALMLLGAHALPFPMMRVMRGISYYRVPITMPYLLMLIPVVVLCLTLLVRRLPQPKTWVRYAEALVMVVLLLVPQEFGFDEKKYEMIEYDQLVRVGNWEAIIAKAEKQTPDKPMSVSATNLALGMTNQLGDHAFDFYQRGSEGLLPRFERNFATAQLTGEIYFHLGLINTAQRFAFEAMEAIPNYNKSARVVKRLAETNMMNGQYEVARKYLQMLEKTIFYRPWAQRMIAMLGDEQAINNHPLYGTLRQYRLQDDFLFSERELDKICGQLFIHNQQNQMAMQYLLMLPLLDKDIPRFMNYVQYVQNKIPYNPRSCQEGIAFAFMQQRQNPPQGVVSQLILQQMNDFARIYSQDKNSPELGRFRNTVWYYLTVGK